METAAAEVLRRLGTGENAGGLTGEEAARRLRVHGPNIVLRSHHSSSLTAHPVESDGLVLVDLDKLHKEGPIDM